MNGLVRTKLAAWNESRRSAARKMRGSFIAIAGLHFYEKNGMIRRLIVRVSRMRQLKRMKSGGATWNETSFLKRQA